MYINVICLKCGKTIPFESVVPYSVDKIAENWNLITDEVNGQIISVRGSEIASVCSQVVKEDAEKVKTEKVTPRKKNGSKARFSASQSKE